MNQPQLAPTLLVFNPRVPAEVKRAVTELFHKWKWLLPRCMEQLIIVFDTDNKNELEMKNARDYRWCSLTIGPAWLISYDREEAFVHDIIHTFNGAQSDFVKSLIDRCVPDGDARGLIKQEWQKYLEAATQDLAFCIVQRERAKSETKKRRPKR